MPHRILVIDDEPSIARLLAHQLGDGYELVAATSGAEGLALIPEMRPDVLICDLRMPRMDGVAVVRALSRMRFTLPVIVTSGDLSLPELTEFLRMNIVDVLVKPFEAGEARVCVARALAVANLQHRTASQELPPGDGSPLDACVGSGALMLSAKEAARRASALPSALLISGPCGSGKTLVARAIHALSAERDGPLIELACGALSESLLEGDLFGHAAGAFTGAERDRPGVFERARGGTLILDEVSVLSPAAQSRLAHALTSGEVTRLGENRARPIETRIIATSQRVLEALVEQGEFRADLFHALAALRLRMPALCEYPPTDLELLCRALLDRTCARLGRRAPGLDASFLESAARMAWPGNARELENLLERAILFGDGSDLSAADLSDAERVPPSRMRLLLPEAGIDLQSALRAVEDHYLDLALERSAGNKERAARLLGLRRTALVEKLRRRAGFEAP